LKTNSTGSSIVNICSHLCLFISFKIEIIDVDLPEPVGQVIRIRPCFAEINLLIHSGKPNSSIQIGSDSILLKTNETFHNLKKAFTLKDVQFFQI